MFDSYILIIFILLNGLVNVLFGGDNVARKDSVYIDIVFTSLHDFLAYFLEKPDNQHTENKVSYNQDYMQ